MRERRRGEERRGGEERKKKEGRHGKWIKPMHRLLRSGMALSQP